MAKKQVLIQKVDNQIRSRRDVHDQLDEWLDEQSNGCLEMLLKRARKDKSHKQVKTIFGHMIEQTIIQCNDMNVGVSDLLVYLIDGRIPKGQAITKDFLHELMYVVCPTTDENGRRITLSKMTTIQANSLFERFRTILGPFGVYIGDPDPDWNEAVVELVKTREKK